MGWWWGRDLVLSDDKHTPPGFPWKLLSLGCSTRRTELKAAPLQNSSFIQALVSARVKLCCQIHPKPCNTQATLGTQQGCGLGFIWTQDRVVSTNKGSLQVTHSVREGGGRGIIVHYHHFRGEKTALKSDTHLSGD